MRVLAVPAATALLLTACGESARGGPSGAGDAATSDELAGRTFVSDDVSGAPQPWVGGTRLSLTFGKDGELTAQAGCNTVGGGYTLDGGALDVPGSLSMTEMACDEPRMAQDEWVADFLGEAPDYALTEDTLTLTRGDTTVRLVDREVAQPDRSLAGTRWVLEAMVYGSDETGAVSSVPAGVHSWLRVSAAGAAEVWTGCREVEARAEVGDATLTVLALASTDPGCADAAGPVEDAVQATLFGTSEWSIGADTLELRQGAGGLVYRAAERG